MCMPVYARVCACAPACACVNDYVGTHVGTRTCLFIKQPIIFVLNLLLFTYFPLVL